MRALFRRIRARYRPMERRERGVAMLIVLTWLALMISLVGEFTYGTTVDAAQAANARDELRAHYLARSAVNLSRLLIKIQQRFIDPAMGQAKQMLQQALGFVPVAVLTAIIVPMILAPHGAGMEINWRNPQLIASIAAVMVAAGVRRQLVTIGVGLTIFFVWQLWVVA